MGLDAVPPRARNHNSHFWAFSKRAWSDTRKSLVETRIQQLVRFDQLGRKTRRVGVRELHIENTPYVVVSRRLDDEILILRIFSNGSAIQAR